MLEHNGRHSMDEVEGRLQVHIDYEIPLIFGHTHHQSISGNPCIINQYVDATKVGDYLIYELMCSLEVRSIRGIGLSTNAQSL